MMYAAECLKLLIKIENELFDTLYNTDAEINVMIRTAANAARLSIQSNSTMSLMIYDDNNYLFVEACSNIEVDCREAKCYTSAFIVKKAVYDLLLDRSYQIVTQMKQMKMNNRICQVIIQKQNEVESIMTAVPAMTEMYIESDVFQQKSLN